VINNDQITYDSQVAEAFKVFVARENLESRWTEGDKIDRAVLEYVADKASVFRRKVP
jgi:hypothetical protein